MLKFILFLNVFVLLLFKVQSEQNLTDWKNLRRQKRTLIWQYGGISKIVCGVILPVNLSDKKQWRMLNLALNIQAQYNVPQTPIYWWDRFDGRSLEDAKREYDLNGIYLKDQSREYIYTAIEVYLNRKGKNGRKCMQRAICENVQIEPEGIFSEIVHVTLSPGDDSDEVDYKDAYKAGKHGADCLTLYPECPEGDGILDGIAVVKSFGTMRENKCS